MYFKIAAIYCILNYNWYLNFSSRLKDRLKTLRVQASKINFHAEAEMEIDLSVMAGGGPAYAALFTEIEAAEDDEMEIRRMYDLMDTIQVQLGDARNELNKIKAYNKEREMKRVAAMSGNSVTSDVSDKETTDKADKSSKDSKPGVKMNSSGDGGKPNQPSNSPEASPKEKRTKTKERQRELDRLLWKLEVDVENVEDILSRYVDNQKETSTVLSVQWQEAQHHVQKKLSEGMETAQTLWNEADKWWQKMRQSGKP